MTSSKKNWARWFVVTTGILLLRAHIEITQVQSHIAETWNLEAVNGNEPSDVGKINQSSRSFSASSDSEDIDLDGDGPIPMPPPSLFLGYASIHGWSNQVMCLKHAYLVAKATGRILVTAPVMTHFNDMDFRLWRKSRFLGNGTISSDFTTEFPLYQRYQKFSTLSLDRVLDLKYTLPNVSTIPYQEFWTRYFANSNNKTNLTQWVMETNYTHGDTTFTYQRPDLESTTVPRVGPEKRYRDLTVIARNQSDKQLWTFLDTFYLKVHPSVVMEMPSLTQEGRDQEGLWTFLDAAKRPEQNPGVYRDRSSHLRYSHVIRQTAQAIHQKVWKNIPYASMHVRVGDGGFNGKASTTMDRSLQQHKRQLENWITNTIAANGTLPPKIGLFVATDMDSSQKQEFQKKLIHHLKALLVKARMNMRVLYSSSFDSYTQQLEDSLAFPGVFLDQQLAACATIEFTGSTRSTFSALIRSIRDSPGACDV